MIDAGHLYLSDTPGGRAVEICARAISEGGDPGQKPMVRKLARIAYAAMLRLEGASATSAFFAGLSRDALEARGQGRGRVGG